jgi:SchA/CurD like domain
MPYAAITYRVKLGHEDEIAEIFAGFQRMANPALHHDDGSEAGGLLGTAVFIKDDVVVRIIHYEGDFATVGRHVGEQRGTHLIEEKLAPYLVSDRDTSTTEGFEDYFRDATMRCISQLPPEPLRAGR